MEVYKIKIPAKRDNKEVSEEIIVCNCRQGIAMIAHRSSQGNED
jgi:hypothetical protein